MAEFKRAEQAGPLALTMGDPAGIGPEIAMKAWSARRDTSIPCFAMIADPDLMARRADALHYTIPISEIDAPVEASEVFEETLPVLPTPKPVKSFEARVPAPENAPSVISAIELGVELVLSGQASALVTNPMSKAVVAAAGFGFRGHTDHLGALAQRHGLNATPVMMLYGGGLRTVPVTVHIALRDVPEALTAERIIETAVITHRALIEDFGIAKPRIALTGLNPHAGEDGTMGTEERDIIDPAIAALANQGIETLGPLPADTAFHAEARQRYDAILGMYHDQALIPVKTLAFDEGVNVTLGLPFVRTSPDHGTAFDIAGTGKARPDSLIAALRLAADMAETRRGRKEGLA
ncbi:4-hydroxythreonine-4-phosphate dehydrogenase PdxA [Dichotomicrobium thermohalophilum]|uniref:4-hydroxythreonine-4-phosphate dehydrogenase n=1 Tax=Dichotomicrobium thermohalophilum TaxID=933063 RepID=A0A397Q5V7_9HYPH|nr:4-hydroxythreonine-4-phosphate dehydrogenase PdxA [Dichotomicrobium thermohalophilum]RIA56482.1 4-hydroxythreonine-4-phosphate dehydrogenase [Dichotomicrobium thermohalophilum]